MHSRHPIVGDQDRRFPAVLADLGEEPERGFPRVRGLDLRWGSSLRSSRLRLSMMIASSSTHST